MSCGQNPTFKWINIWTDAEYEGGQTIAVGTPLAEILSFMTGGFSIEIRL
jgi:alpha-glucosidase (family GH31 glycosyl hydrolase)